jgi:hypothetical protein
MSDLDELRRRVQRLEDLESIRRLKARYLNACDAQDPQRAKECFASGEVLIDMGHVGVFKDREAFAALYKAAGANTEIELLDDTHARAQWALEYRNINTQARTVTFISLVYHDEYAKQGGEWKITKSRSEFKTALHCSYADGALHPQLAARSVAGTVSYEQ